MYVQLNAVIVDADGNNRQELAGFLSGFGINLVGQYPTSESLAVPRLNRVLGRPRSALRH